MFCQACGARNSVTARSCGNCGTGLVAHCPGCQAEVQVSARFCSTCGQALAFQPPATNPNALDHPMGQSGERKQVTILFADFSGFTAFSAQLDPEDLRDNMNTIWANLDSIILAHGGTPEKHGGDSVMAVFGGWQSREEDPAEAVRAALAMQEWLKARTSGTGQTSLPLRVGIHTGLVVVGSSNHKGEFLATGDTVNLASRLEQGAPAGEVVVSLETYRHVYGLFDVKAQPLLTVKGRSEPLQTYRVVRAKPRGMAALLRGIEGVETKLIGRDRDLKNLQTVLENVMRDNSPRLITVVGEAGMGKSRLLHEFHLWMELHPQNFRMFRGRATSETSKLPFAVIRDLLFTRCEIQESDAAPVVRKKLEDGLAGLLGEDPEAGVWSREALMPDIHSIGHLLGLDFSASPHLRDILGAAEQLRPRAFEGFCRLLNGVFWRPASEQVPKNDAVVLVVEDLRWCDDESLDLIEHLIRSCRNLPLLILGTARHSFFELHPNWCRGLENVSRLNLVPLTLADSNALVESLLLKAGEVPAALKELLTEGTDGNPFYIEEMIKMFMEQKVIVPEVEPWRIDLGRLASARIPSTLTGVLQARLDGLSPDERLVLLRASVVGRVFWDDAIGQMGSGADHSAVPRSPLERVLDRTEIRRALEGLRRKELIFRSESSAFAGSTEYHFKHDLLRTVAYESLLKKFRRQYHTRVAEWLRQHGGDRVAEIAALVAGHFEQASRPAEAAEWYGWAGTQASLGYAHAIAAGHFKKALQLLPEPVAGEPAATKLRLEWQAGLSESLGAQACFSEALTACATMQKLAQQLSDSVAEARAWNEMAFLHERRGANRESLICAEQAEMLARQSPEAGRAERIRASHFKGWAYYRLSDADAVLALGDQSLKLCTEQGDLKGTANSFKLLGVAHLQLGHYPEADQFFKQGLELFQLLCDRRNAAAMWSNRGETARACGDYRAAADLYAKALAIAREIGHRESELVYLANLGAARVGLKEFVEAELDLRRVINETLDLNSCTLSEAFSSLSEACLGQERLPEAIEAARQAVALAKDSENPLFLGAAWRALGRCAARSSVSDGHPRGATSTQSQPATDAAGCFAESLRVFEQIKAEGDQARTLRAWAESELDDGKVESARKKLDLAREIFRRLGADFEVASIRSSLRNKEINKSGAAVAS